MSAIAGIVFFDETAMQSGLIERMTATMEQRGHDGIHHWQQGGAALGHCMLCTTAEATRERQPLALDDGSAVLVFDGRIDNRQQLHKDLLARGVLPRDDTDAELVLRAWQCWGEECPIRLLGDFVFFVWCTTSRRLFGARDTAGVRHCHYASGNGWFAFATEMRPLFATGLIERRLNKDFLYDYIGDQFDRIDDSSSWFDGIQRLPLANAIAVTASGSHKWRYWQVEHQPQQNFASLQDCREGFVDVLTQAIECRLRSNGPVGVMLSGGMDSSAITGLIGKRLQHCLQQPLHSYSLVRADREHCLDWPHIQTMLADNPQLSPTIIDSALSADQCHQLLALIPQLDNPQAMAEAMPHIILAEAAQARGCRVLLDGFASDLLFLQPETSLDLAFKYRLWASVPAILASWRRHHVAGAGRNLLRLALRELLPAVVTDPYRRVHRQRLRQRELEQAIAQSLLPRAQALAYITQRQTLCSQLDAPLLAARPQAPELPALLRPMLGYAYEVNDPLFGHHQVEVRGPFADRRVLEFAFAMPLEAKFARGWTKGLLRECMAGIVPDSVRQRRQIVGHPGWKFYQGVMQHWAGAAPEFWFSPQKEAGLRALLDSAAVDSLFAEAGTAGGFDAAMRTMKLAVICRWLHTFGFDSAGFEGANSPLPIP